MTNRLDLTSFAETSLKVAARSWFVVTVLGQLVFAIAVAVFYGLTALRGDYHGWKFSGGFSPGITKANWAVVMHLVSAVFIMLAGALQLVPQVRQRFPVFHRWNGRVYMLAAVALSAAGVYMTWFRAGVGDLTQHMGSTLNAILIWLFAAVALRYALARDFKTHRRWALRLFMVVSASWFFRIEMCIRDRYRVNPLTVLKSYQELVDEGLVESKRGLGMFINAGTRNVLLQGERKKFLAEEWPRVSATIQRLGLKAEELLTASENGKKYPDSRAADSRAADSKTADSKTTDKKEPKR